MSFEGSWIVTQSWKGLPTYKFTMTVNKLGVITVNGGYVGVINELGTSSFLSMAITNYAEKSVTAYAGNIAGQAMGGTMSGTQGNKLVSGIWSAMQEAHHNAPEQQFSVAE